MAEILQKMMEAVTKAINNALGASLLDIAIQIGATLILVLIVRFFFWNKITAFLDQRRELMQQELDSAKTANEDAKALQEKSDKEYQELKAQSKDIIEKARKRGEEERGNILNKAKAEAQDIMDQTQAEIELEKKKAQSDIRKEAVDLAALMAAKIIEKEIDGSEYQDLTADRIESSEKI